MNEATGCKRRKRAQQSHSAAASARRRQRRIKSWREVDALLQEAKDNIRNNHGRKRTYKEREMIGLVLIREVERRVGDKVRSGEYIGVTTLQWTSIEKEVVRTLKVQQELVTEIHHLIFEDGEVAEADDESPCEAGSFEYDKSKFLVVKDHDALDVANWVDEVHLKGTTICNRDVMNYFWRQKQIEASRRMVEQLMK